MPGVAGLVWCETRRNLVLSRSAASGKMLLEPRDGGGDSRENRWISLGFFFPGVFRRFCEEEMQKAAD